MTREDVVQYICIYFFKKVNISEIKYNSLFGTRAICSNIFQRMSRRYTLKIALKRLQKKKNKSYVLIFGSVITLRHSGQIETGHDAPLVPGELFPLWHWWQWKHFKTLLTLFALVTLFYRCLSSCRNLKRVKWKMRVSVTCLDWVIVAQWNRGPSLLGGSRFFVNWYLTYQKVTYQNQLRPEQLIGAL